MVRENNADKKLVYGTTLQLVHQECEYDYSNGYKANTPTGYVGDGYFLFPQGFGWGIAMRPSKLTLKVKLLDGRNVDVWVDHYFKEHWGKLTKTRVNAIRNTMSKYVFLREQISKKGTQYYVLDDQYYENWLICARMGDDGIGMMDRTIEEAFKRIVAEDNQ